MPAHSHNQRLEFEGRQAHNGHRIPSKAFSFAGTSWSSVTRPGAPASRNQARQRVSTFAGEFRSISFLSPVPTPIDALQAARTPAGRAARRLGEPDCGTDSVGAKSQDWIDARGAAGWNAAGEDGDGGQNERHADEADRVGRRHVVQERPNESRDQEGAGTAEDYSDGWRAARPGRRPAPGCSAASRRAQRGRRIPACAALPSTRAPRRFRSPPKTGRPRRKSRTSTTATARTRSGSRGFRRRCARRRRRAWVGLPDRVPDRRHDRGRRDARDADREARVSAGPGTETEESPAVRQSPCRARSVVENPRRRRSLCATRRADRRRTGIGGRRCRNGRARCGGPSPR